MPKVKNHIRLEQVKREQLTKIVQCGAGKAKEILHANILLLTDEVGRKEKLSEQKIADLLQTSKQTVNAVKKRYCAKGIISISRKKQDKPSRPSKFTGDVEARIIALACGQSPKGTAHWSLRLIADKAVELQYVDKVSHEGIKLLLKKHNISLT